jgi:PadR family transcriptional regulator PadR
VDSSLHARTERKYLTWDHGRWPVSSAPVDFRQKLCHLLSVFDRRYASRDQPDVLRGTLDLLVLKTLALEPMHGWGISARIQQFSRGVLEVNQGSLYPALQRLEQKGWIESAWKITENNRRAKYYHLTASGRRALGGETASWRRYVGAVELILDLSQGKQP